MGWLRWPPPLFWASTFKDLQAAVRGFSDSRGAKDEDDTDIQDDLDDYLRDNPDT